MKCEQLISVVIPTINRPQLVPGAVGSALRQTLHEIEVIVVVDGPDAETLRVLRSIADPRLRIIPLRQNVGLGAARHAGVSAARSEWVALLDDDDEWLPQKLEVQLDTARRSRHRLPIVTCRVIARRHDGDVVRPQRRLTQGEALSEYLFCRTGLLSGEGLILPSTLLAPRALLGEIPFRYRGAPFEGSDWLLRAVQKEGVGVEFVATSEPLALWRCEQTRERMSNSRDWRASLAWANAEAALLTPRARAGFILSRVSLEARRAGDARAFWRLPWEAFRRGRPTLVGLLAHAFIWLLPLGVRAAVAVRLPRGFSAPIAAAAPPPHDGPASRRVASAHQDGVPNVEP
jgi:glycosyltransferase involved in cell wall biosynthesis